MSGKIFFGEGAALVKPDLDTRGVAYWGEGGPLAAIYNPANPPTSLSCEVLVEALPDVLGSVICDALVEAITIPAPDNVICETTVETLPKNMADTPECFTTVQDIPAYAGLFMVF